MPTLAACRGPSAANHRKADRIHRAFAHGNGRGCMNVQGRDDGRGSPDPTGSKAMKKSNPRRPERPRILLLPAAALSSLLPAQAQDGVRPTQVDAIALRGLDKMTPAVGSESICQRRNAASRALGFGWPAKPSIGPMRSNKRGPTCLRRRFFPKGTE